ncbi:rna-directed dna polymerase from mobile element jockey-like [Limosa lapponica baueri]|uniref:Rna-directed dna polymerase from mobile element jockey-like n=1 Tax=Limosa lapponica baueri TaxID=1758121 RepID=A0A2I0TS90_LIMLA|nr:rna-directed dna polymerase from mobile element jockey-like [Limosa lapponica baueri]
MTHLVDEGKAVDVVYLDFSKAFDTISYSILLEKLTAHVLERRTVRWVKNWLEGQAQRVVVDGVKSSWRPVTVVFPRARTSGVQDSEKTEQKKLQNHIPDLLKSKFWLVQVPTWEDPKEDCPGSYHSVAPVYRTISTVMSLKSSNWSALTPA